LEISDYRFESGIQRYEFGEGRGARRALGGDWRFQITDFRGCADFRGARADKGREHGAHPAVIKDYRFQRGWRFQRNT
jgi:hypothetical protein